MEKVLQLVFKKADGSKKVFSVTDTVRCKNIGSNDCLHRCFCFVSSNIIAGIGHAENFFAAIGFFKYKL